MAKMGPPPVQYVVNLWDPDAGRPAAQDAGPGRRRPDAEGRALPAGGDQPRRQDRGRGPVPQDAPSSLWSADDGRGARRDRDAQTELTALALGPDNQLATAGSGEIRLWDTATRGLRCPASPRTRARSGSCGSARRGRCWPWWARGPRRRALGHRRALLVAVLPTTDRVGRPRLLARRPDPGRGGAAARPPDDLGLGRGRVRRPRSRLGGFDAMTRSMAFRADGLLAMGAFNGRSGSGARAVASTGATSMRRPPARPGGTGRSRRRCGRSRSPSTTAAG